MSLDPITRKEIFMAKAAGEKVLDITPVTREEIFLSRIAGGGGADLLNADGVIKQEHLPEGYPYKMVEEGYILEECQPPFVEEMGGFVIMNEIRCPAVGETCIVTYNGTEYECIAQLFSEDGVTEAGVMLGNAGMMTGNPTSEPFVAMIPLPELGAEMGMYGMVMPIDGATSITLSIYSKGYYEKLNNNLLNLAWIPDYTMVENPLLSEKDFTNVEAGKGYNLSASKIITKPYPSKLIVYINEEKYICDFKTFAGEIFNKAYTHYAGNLAICLASEDDTGEPFVIFADEAYPEEIYFKEAGIHKITVLRYENGVRKLKQEMMPVLDSLLLRDTAGKIYKMSVTTGGNISIRILNYS